MMIRLDRINDKPSLSSLNICFCVLGRNKCVKLMREQSRSWIDSEKLCRSEEGAELITIDNQEEQRAMEDIVFNR